jgi:hypothetical protein
MDKRKEREGSLLIIASISLIALALLFGKQKYKEVILQSVPMSAITLSALEESEASRNSPARDYELLDTQKSAICKDLKVTPEIQMFQSPAATKKSPLSKKYIFSSEGASKLMQAKTNLSFYWKVTPPRRSSIHPQIKRGSSLELYPDISGGYSIRLLVVKDRIICGHKDVKVQVFLPGSTPAKPLRSSRIYVFNDLVVSPYFKFRAQTLP